MKIQGIRFADTHRLYLHMGISILGLVGLYMARRYNFLLFHSLAEFFSILIGSSIFLFAWNTRKLMKNDFLLFLGIAYLFVSMLDLLHALSYSGMQIFPDFGANVPTQLWIVARYTESISLLIAPIFLTRKLNQSVCFSVFGICTILLIGSIMYWLNFPDCFIQGEGLTPFKKNSEYIISLILFCAIASLITKRRSFEAEVLRLMVLSIVLTIIAELAFTFYIQVYGLSNMIGHCLKVVSFYLIYRAIITTGLTKPYSLLFRDLLQKEKQLTDARDALEVRVQERTRELTVVNKKLLHEIAEKETAQEELKKSKKRLQATIRAAEDVSFILIDISPSTVPRIIEFSPGAERLLFCKRHEIIGQTIDTFFDPDDTPKFPEILTLLRQGKKGYDGELTMVRSNGEAFPAYVSFTPIHNTFDGPTALGVSIDISKSKQVEEEVQRWAQVFKFSEWGVAVVSADGITLEMANPAYAKMHGYAVEELIGKSLDHVLAADSRLEAKQHFLVADDKGHHSFESNNIRSDGKVFPALIDVTVIKNELGTIRYRVLNIQDISPRIKAREQILRAKEEWERTFDAIGDIAVILDPDLRITRLNWQGCSSFKTKPQNMLGKFCYQVFQDRSQPCETCPVLSALRNGATHMVETEYSVLGKSFLVTASPVLDSAGTATSVIHLAKDITERKNLENKLRQAQKMEAIGTLAGGIAHDFNNLLTPIIGYSEMLLGSVPFDSELADEIKDIQYAAHRAADLVKQILFFSRQTEQELKPMRLQPVIKETLKLLRSSIPTTIEIKQDIDTGCGPVLADPTQIHQIVMNLCTNSYQAMKKSGGILQVKLQTIQITNDDLNSTLNLKQGTYGQLTVADTGHGMNQIILERVFEPYYTTKGKGEGTGLGLSVVYGIVNSLGGEIKVYSEYGQGTTFRVYLPLLERASDTFTSKPLDKAAIGGSERILVVDDEKGIAIMEEKILESLGYQVTAYANSEDCLLDFQSRPHDYDLLITDMTMPKITGEGLAKQVLALRPDMPILLCTGFSEIITEDRAREIGIQGFIMKPITKTLLAEKVREILDFQKQPADI